jgi:hypothetical protein
MKKTSAISVLLALFAAIAPAREVDRRSVDVPRQISTETDGSAWRQLGFSAEVRRVSAALDTTFLLNHDFEGPGATCDAMGWTPNDDTRQLDNYWHVDDFAGLTGVHGGLSPLEGNQSMWCGARPDATDPIECSYVNLPGYANDWYQWIRTDQCLAVNGDVELSFQVFWDTEGGYDFIFIQWDECDNNWQDLVPGGLDQVGQWDTTLTVANTLHSGNVRFRFLFRSDGYWSDGDGEIDTDGACTIDMLRVDDVGGNVLALEDFEDEFVGEPDGDDWISEVADPYGELAGLFWGPQVVQEDPCVSNLSCLWGFFSGSTSNYSCGSPSYPEQPTVPYENARGQFVDQQIRSPWIELTGTGSLIELDYSTYIDLPVSGGVFADWHVRGIDSTAANPCPSQWYGDPFLEEGSDKIWRRGVRRIGPYIPAGSTHIQVSLEVVDICFSFSICGFACHSHAPLYDDVTVYRVGAAGPQWTIEDMHQFQDTFPDDGTITGTARADMARDLNLSSSRRPIVPGDSATVRVIDPAAGLGVEGNGKAAVFCYVSIDGPNAGTTATSLICDSRYNFVADESWGGRTWHKFQADSCYTAEGDAVPGDYNFDFCDNLFVPGDTIWFFWGARNANGNYAYASAALGTSGNQTADGDEAASNADEFQILPAVGRDEADGGLGGEILYVDGMNFRGAQPYFDTAFRALNIHHLTDRYDIRAPSSGVGNHPGSRVKSVLNQLVPIYKAIVWNTGDLRRAFAEGTGGLDKSDDTGMCLAFMNNLNAQDRGGIYLSGDDVASAWLQMSGTSATILRNNYMRFDVTSSDHLPIVGYNPWGIGVPGGIFSEFWGDDTLAVQGGCPTPKDFDVLQAIAPDSRIEMNYHNWAPDYASAPAVLSQTSENTAGQYVRFVLSGFSFHNIRDRKPRGLLARFVHMEQVLSYLRILTHIGDAGTRSVAQNRLTQNAPNPFNPTTTIAYEVKESGPVSLKIYNVAGQLVKTLVDGPRSAGRVYEARWSGLNDSGQPVASGVYFYKLVARGFTQTKKMVLLK